MTPTPRQRWALALASIVVVAVLLATFVVHRSGTDGGRADGPAPSSDATIATTSTDPTTSTTSTTASGSAPHVATLTSTPTVDAEVPVAVHDDGDARVIVQVATTPNATEGQRDAAVEAQLARLRTAAPGASLDAITTSPGSSYFAVTVDRSGLEALTAQKGLVDVRLSHRLEPTEIDAVTGGGAIAPASTNANVVDGATAAWAAGQLGAGATVAIVDTGVDTAHPFLNATPKTFYEGCFANSGGGWISTCPGGVSMGIYDAPVPGSAAPCPYAACDHGTHVAGIAAGGTGTGTISGIAPAANIVAVQVFAYNPSTGKVSADEFDVYNALRWLHNEQSLLPGLVSVNLSLGDGIPQSDYCDSSIYKSAIDQLLIDGIATVVAAGNERSSNGVSSPGCVSTAVTIGAVDDTAPATSAYFSNDGMQLDLMAPGVDICSSAPGSAASSCPAPSGGRMVYKSGTSMATPVVTGAYATLAGAGVTPGQRLAALRRVPSGGSTVTAGAWAVPLVHLDVALGLAPAASLVGVTPARILDTRESPAGPLAPTEVRDLKVTGVGGVPVAGAVAVALNVTVDGPTAGSYLTVYPKSTTRPTASNLNFVPGQTVPNMVMVAVGGGGSVSLFNFAGATNVIVDVVGWVTDSASYGALTPQRMLDTRTGADYTTIDGSFRGTGPIGANSKLSLRVTGRGSVPSSGIGSVVLNVTSIDSTAGGYLTVSPTGSPRPTASSLNFLPGSVTPNLVLARVGTGGSVDIYNFTGASQVVVDVLGWFPSTASTFHSNVPARFMDTRIGPSYSTFDGQALGQGAIGSGQVRTLQITGRGGIVPSTVSAVALNVTATGATAGGYLTVFPSDVARPTASNLNFTAGATIANSVISRVAPDGTISIYNFTGATQVVVDVVGYFP